jgi:hypothetical protein
LRRSSNARTRRCRRRGSTSSRPTKHDARRTTCVACSCSGSSPEKTREGPRASVADPLQMLLDARSGPRVAFVLEVDGAVNELSFRSLFAAQSQRGTLR